MREVVRDLAVHPVVAGAYLFVPSPRQFFFLNDTAPTEIYTSIDTLSLHDALPISDNVAFVWSAGSSETVTRAFESAPRSEEHTSELQSPIDISYAVFCLKKKK